jgi:hypothetical protein
MRITEPDTRDTGRARGADRQRHTDEECPT